MRNFNKQTMSLNLNCLTNRFFTTSQKAYTENIINNIKENNYKTKNFIFQKSNGYTLIENIIKSNESCNDKQMMIEEAMNRI